MNPRDAEHSEIDQLAEIWYTGWQEAHAGILPAELSRLRTRESFAERLHNELAHVRVVGAPGDPLGFCITKGDELNQLYVAERGRGTGIAAALIADAEALIADRGFRTAWLACGIGNWRAARFYEKSGWHQSEVVTVSLETSDGPFPLEVWRYEKPLAAG